ncbi:MAG: glycosyltransferase family 2 protein [Candidatus Obscuribacterales bacterium]|nr:glycosyltransferase family 2 protein [Candidatus Obscuribacterales bacterium]
MVNQPQVSIVIVNWKTPELLASCLNSIRVYTKKVSYEIWVVDNNSGDHSVELVKRDFPEVQLIANNQNVGFAVACNQVIPSTNGNYVLLLNPDTVLVDDSISTLCQYMDKQDKCGAAGPKVLNPDGSLQLACRRAFPTPAAAFFRLTYLSLLFPKHPLLARYNLTHADPDSELDVDALSGSCMMVRKAAIDQIGLLDEDIFMYGEDIDWCWRLKQSGWTVNYLPSAVVYHYHGASSRFRRVGATINLHKGMEVFYRKYFAQKYWAPFNWLIYAAIWLRATIFILLSCLQNLLPTKSTENFKSMSAEPKSAQGADCGQSNESDQNNESVQNKNRAVLK